MKLQEEEEEKKKLLHRWRASEIRPSVSQSRCICLNSRLRRICRFTYCHWATRASRSFSFSYFSHERTADCRLGILRMRIFYTRKYMRSVCGVLSLCVAHAYTSQKLFSRTVIIWKENLLHDIVIRERVCVALRTVGRCCACADVWVSVWSCIKFLFFPLLPNRHWCLLTAKSHTSDEKLGFSAGNARKKIVGCWRLGTMREKSLTSFCVSFSERARGHVCRADNEFVWALRAVRDSVWRDARKQHTKTAATKIISHAYRNRYTLKTKLCYWGSKRFISEQN